MIQIFNNIKQFFKNLKQGTLHIGRCYWTNPFKYYISSCLYWKRPTIKFYLGRIGYKVTGVYDHDSSIVDKDGKHLYQKGDPIKEQCGVWPFVTWNYLTWYMPKWCQKYFPLTVISRDVGWKDKWNEPRFERNPIFTIIWGTDINKAWQFAFTLKAPKVDFDIPENIKNNLKNCKEPVFFNIEDDYWETMLWYCAYAKKKFKEAYKTWPNGHWSTVAEIGVDDEGKPILDNIDLGPSWNKNFFTKLGKKLIQKVQEEQKYEDLYNLKIDL